MAAKALLSADTAPEARQTYGCKSVVSRCRESSCGPISRRRHDASHAEWLAEREASYALYDALLDATKVPKLSRVEE